MNRGRHRPPGLLGWLLLCGCFLGAGANLHAQAASEYDCSSCHDQGQKLPRSAHATLTCATCHVKHEIYPHPQNLPKPACTACHESVAKDYERSVHGQAARSGNAAPDCAICHGNPHELLRPRSTEFRSAVPETCGACHSEVVDQYKTSVHGRALSESPSSVKLLSNRVTSSI